MEPYGPARNIRTQYERALVQLHSLGKLLLTTVCLVVWVFDAHAQDPVFSQFYLNKNYLNPAYAGYSEDLQIGVNSRVQWSNVPGEFSTNTFSVNLGCAPGRLGIGLMGYDHTEGEGFLNTKKADLQVSVNLPGQLGRWAGRKMSRKKFILSGGLGLGVGQKQLDWSKLTFTDQYSTYEGFLNQPSAIQGYSERSNIIFDMSAGFRLQAAITRKGSYISMGASAFHMNRPVESFFGIDSRLQPRYTAHFFTYFQTKKFANKPSYLSLGMITDKQQGMLTNTWLASKDVGNHAKFGLGFRRQNFLMIDENVDALILQAIVGFGSFNLGYSYDITISSLGPHRTFGTHEIGLTYTFEGFTLCSGKSRGRKGRKSADDCFMLMSDINPNFRKLFLWNP